MLASPDIFLTIVLVLLVQLFAFGLWVGGPRTDTSRNCVFNLRLGENFGHSINCDSSEFVYAAAEPANVLAPESKLPGLWVTKLK